MNVSTSSKFEESITLFKQAKEDEAIPILEELLQETPKDGRALVLLGNLYLSKRRMQDAIKLLNRASDIKESHDEAQKFLAIAFHLLGELDKAHDLYSNIFSIFKSDELYLANYASLLLEIRQPEKAREIAQSLIEQFPNNANGYHHVAKSYHDQGQWIKSREFFEKAIEVNPNYVNALNSLGAVYSQLGLIEESKVCFDRAIALNPNFLPAYQNLALLLLRRGHFEQGWKYYEFRTDALSQARLGESNENDFLKNNFMKPSEIKNADTSDKTLLVLSDQGIGDEIFFLRFIPTIKQKFKNVYYNPSTKVEPFVKHWDSLDGIVLQELTIAQAKDAGIEYWVSVSDLGALSGMKDFETPPPTLKYEAPPALIDETLRVLKDYPKPWIGLTWKAGTKTQFGLDKSVPLDQLCDVIPHNKGTLFIIQRHPESEDLNYIRTRFKRVFDASSVNDDLVGMMALLKCLDDYVTVSNSNVHMGTMSGMKARILLPFPAEFRWMAEGDRSPWFPDYPLYRQSNEGDWTETLEQLKRDLEPLESKY